MRIVGRHISATLDDDGLEIERNDNGQFIKLDRHQGSELFVFLEMIKTGSNTIVMHKRDDESEQDNSGQGYM